MWLSTSVSRLRPAMMFYIIQWNKIRQQPLYSPSPVTPLALFERPLVGGWMTPVCVSGLFLITVQIWRACSRGSEAKIYIKVMGMSPGQACRYRCSRCSRASNDASGHLIIHLLLFIRQWHHGSSSLRHLGAWNGTGPEQLVFFPPCDMKDALKHWK